MNWKNESLLGILSIVFQHLPVMKQGSINDLEGVSAYDTMRWYFPTDRSTVFPSYAPQKWKETSVKRLRLRTVRLEKTEGVGAVQHLGQTSF
jgi:hypothetical protein